ncbi:hypothetical protein LZ554_002373 [Drepanopeziza brunnea f. sp. 'monogermtubi']|nr:hypothetical protein LZ554_002373 [Drepanopeziza brunnea f. sp. 'monogermtubi']
MDLKDEARLRDRCPLNLPSLSSLKAIPLPPQRPSICNEVPFFYLDSSCTPHTSRSSKNLYNMASALKSVLSSHLKPGDGEAAEFVRKHHGKTQSHMAFENTSTSVAASQMRNALNNLADTVTDPTEKKLFETEMDNFFALFRRYLNDKAKGNQLDWDHIAPPAQNQVVDYNELANSESADVKGGTIIDYEGSVRLLEIAQVPKEHTNEFKSIKKFKYFNTNNIWLNLKAVKRIVENNALEMEIIPNSKTIPADKKGESDISIVQLETAVGAAIRHFKNAHGVNVPRRRFLPVKTCSDLMLVKSDLYSLKHGQLQIDPNRFGPAPLIKLGNDFKKVSDFQKRIGSIPKIIELDHLTITGAVNLGRGVTLKGTVIIVATEGSTIDIPPGSILENVVVQGSLRLLEH